MTNKKMLDEKLIEEAPSKTVIAFDIFDNKLKRNLKNFRFRVSAYGILEKDGQVLLNRNPTIKQFGLPGGGIKIGETQAHGLEREYWEETGLRVKITELFNVDENLFTCDGQDAHGIMIFYKVRMVSGKITTNDYDSVEVKWINKKDITQKLIHRSCWPTIKKLIED